MKSLTFDSRLVVEVWKQAKYKQRRIFLSQMNIQNFDLGQLGIVCMGLYVWLINPVFVWLFTVVCVIVYVAVYAIDEYSKGLS